MRKGYLIFPIRKHSVICNEKRAGIDYFGAVWYNNVRTHKCLYTVKVEIQDYDGEIIPEDGKKALELFSENYSNYTNVILNGVLAYYQKNCYLNTHNYGTPSRADGNPFLMPHIQSGLQSRRTKIKPDFRKSPVLFFGAADPT